jgi:hypothetical protein
MSYYDTDQIRGNFLIKLSDSELELTESEQQFIAKSLDKEHYTDDERGYIEQLMRKYEDALNW